MIIGVDCFNSSFDTMFYDTAIPTSELDEVTMGAGMYDEMFISLDTSIDHAQVKPDQWKLKTIMDAEFNNNLEAGSINGHNHVIDRFQCYRREYQNPSSDWQLVGQFDYDDHYNLYTVIDRFIENHKIYEYSIVPLSKQIMGDVLMGPPITSEFTGMFISDIESNYSMEVNFKFSDLAYNTTMAQHVPLNGKFPIVTFGNAEYRTGSATFLPLTPQTEYGYSSEINAHDEFANRRNVINFLNNGRVKVVRREDGDTLVVVTYNVRSQALSDSLDSISEVTFDFVEIGGLDYNTMEKAGLISNAGKSVYTYDDFGEIVWTSERVNDGARARYRNSFAA